ncbi:MAG: rhomboid family intramembrane serine protease [Bacteroidia bacterium]
MSSFADDIKSPFKTGNSVGQLIVINVSVFMVLVIFQFILTISGFPPDESSSVFHRAVSWIALPMHFNELLYKPWTFITYMFVHYSLWHIFGNMLMLFVFGKIFQEYASSKRVFAVYMYGALIGALLALVTYQFIPTFKLHAPADFMVGASAGVMAIVLAAATLVPDYVLHLLLIGQVRLKYIALFVVVLDMIGVTYFNNAGGHISHLGGALFGYVFVAQMKKGTDLSSGFNNLTFRLKKIFNRKSKIKVVHKRSISDEEYNLKRKIRQEEIDEILDKISSSGYESLTKKEKEILFKASNENK